TREPTTASAPGRSGSSATVSSAEAGGDAATTRSSARIVGDTRRSSRVSTARRHGRATARQVYSRGVVNVFCGGRVKKPGRCSADGPRKREETHDDSTCPPDGGAGDGARRVLEPAGSGAAAGALAGRGPPRGTGHLRADRRRGSRHRAARRRSVDRRAAAGPAVGPRVVSGSGGQRERGVPHGLGEHLRPGQLHSVP